MLGRMLMPERARSSWTMITIIWANATTRRRVTPRRVISLGEAKTRPVPLGRVFDFSGRRIRRRVAAGDEPPVVASAKAARSDTRGNATPAMTKNAAKA